jgi:hypothetical protein
MLPALLCVPAKTSRRYMDVLSRLHLNVFRVDAALPFTSWQVRGAGTAVEQLLVLPSPAPKCLTPIVVRSLLQPSIPCA